MHYVFDLDKEDEHKHGILNHIRHIGRVRRRHHSEQPDQGSTVQHLLRGALIPIGLMASEQHRDNQEVPNANAEGGTTSGLQEEEPQSTRPKTPLSAPIKNVTFTLEGLDAIDDDQMEIDELLGRRSGNRSGNRSANRF